MRDIIIVIGPICSGKTFAVNILKQWFSENDIPVESETKSDSQTLLNEIELDDLKGGFNHYHPWCVGNINGHEHTDDKLQIPFTAYGNTLPDRSYENFFKRLNTLAETNKFWIAELSGGVNTNRISQLENQINISFLRISNMLSKDIFTEEWLKRIYAVIHPKTTFSIRKRLNTKTKLEPIEIIRKNLASPYETRYVLQVTGNDDFQEIRKLFEDHNIPHIYEIPNTGDAKFVKDLEIVATKIFSPDQLIMNRKKPSRDIVLVVGRPGSGKKTVLDYLYKTADQLSVPYNHDIISDFDNLLDQVTIDDARGGYNHYHPWCKRKNSGHKHISEESHFPFIVTNNQIIERAFGDFFNRLNKLPTNRKVWFAEWTGGINVNPSYELSSSLDVSFQKIGKFLSDGTYPTDWFMRIAAIVNPLTNDAIQSNLNEEHHITSLKNIKKDKIISPKKNDTVLRIFGKDDFYRIEKFFHEAYVPMIYHFEHEGDTALSLYSEKITSTVVGQFSAF